MSVQEKVQDNGTSTRSRKRTTGEVSPPAEDGPIGQEQVFIQPI
jgi:hypothetical protein